MRLRVTAAVAIGIVLAVLLLRFAVVRADPESAFARKVWPEHPAVLAASAMREVGLAAAKGASPSQAIFAKLQKLATEAPLAVEPFLVEGAVAEKQGKLDRAAQLYREALRRDPRSIAGHYLLTDLDLRSGRATDGIRELAELSRLVPASSVQLAPAIAQFSRSPGAAGELRQIFRSNPQLEQPVLNVLAGDPANAQLILSVATQTKDTSGAPPSWQQKLIETMVAQGEYQQAYAIWARLSGKSGSPGGLFNPDFRRLSAPPPFNWSFVSAEAGVAEPENGSLRILFYGRDNAVLAREIMLLPAGRYRLGAPVTITSGNGGALVWSVDCLTGNKHVLDLPLPAGGAALISAAFEIPEGCQAQAIELDGKIEDSPETTDSRIAPLSLQRIGG